MYSHIEKYILDCTIRNTSYYNMSVGLYNLKGKPKFIIVF